MKLIHKNKKAYFDYEILDKFIAGMVLNGPEIKSIRSNQINLKGAYVSESSGELFLKKANIARYPFDSNPNYEPFRSRKLLLKEKEIEKIKRELNQQGVTIVPLAIGLEGKWAKCEIGIARGKKKHDKRNLIKERSEKRQLDRVVKGFNK